MLRPSFLVERRVEFCETDAAGIVHFTAFFQYMEQTEHALLRHLGYSVVQADEQGVVSWPRVSAHCDYSAPVKFEQVLQIALQVERLGTKSVTYGCEFRLGEQIVATGQLTAVCCRILPQQPPCPIPIPEPLARALRAYTREA